MVEALVKEVKGCRVCEPFLEHGVNPVLCVHPKSKIVIIGQAPGSKVHESGVPWQDKSGERLRTWLNVTVEQFYNPEIFAILPMGFCYPGKGNSGDLPPRPECAPLWHKSILSMMDEVSLTLLIGQYAQAYYLGDNREKTLTKTVQNFRAYLPNYLPLPHPSPRNNIWLRRNPWFEQEILPLLQSAVLENLKKE